MNVKQTVKKMSAVAAGVFMVGLTVSSASALDLSDYPEPFVQDGAFEGKIVIGASAQAADNIAAIDISTSLQAASVTPVDGSGSSVVVTGGEEINTYLNALFPSSTLELTRSDLAGFQDRTISWDGKSIRTEEVLELDEEGMRIRTSSALTGSIAEEYGQNPFLNIDRDSVKYKYVFNSDVDVTRLSERTLTVNFLGQELRIINGDDGSVTLEASREKFLRVGETSEVDGYTVSIRTIGSSSVEVDVNGERRIISEGNDRTFDDGNFIVEVDSILFVEAGDAGNAALLKFGEELTYTIETNDPAELFGEPDDTAEAEWLWEVEVNNSMLEHIAIFNNIDRRDVEVEHPEERPALGIGESFEFPNGFVAVTFEGFEDSARSDVMLNFRDFQFRDENDDLVPGRVENLAISSTASGDVFYLDGASLRTDEVYITGVHWNGAEHLVEYGYRDDNKRIRHSTDRTTDEIEVRLKRQQTDFKISAFANATGSYIRFSAGPDTFDFHVSATEANAGTPTVPVTDRFGARDGEADATDFVVNDVNFGKRDYGIMTTYGVTFDSPESQLDGDRFRMSVPHERADAIVSVTTRDSTRTSTGSTGGAYVVNPISGAAILDTEASGLLGNTPLIVVGGPYVNTVAATLLGNPSEEEVEEMFESGLAKIRLFAEQNALLVAGYSATDTRGAGYVLANYQDFASQMTGTEVEVVVTDATTVQVRQPTN
ncbi:MAG: hypothetical protein ACMXX6_01170 [Candidatus Woesearchaeota archaeon]